MIDGVVEAGLSGDSLMALPTFYKATSFWLAWFFCCCLFVSFCFFFLFLYLFYSMCLGVLHACMYVHHMCAWCSQRSEEGTDLLELELQMVIVRSK